MRRQPGRAAALMIVAAMLVALLVAGCDASATEGLQKDGMEASATQAEQASVTPTPSKATEKPSATPTRTETPSPTPSLSASPSPVPTEEPTPAATPVPSGPETLASASERLQVDITGDGQPNTVLFDPTNADGSGYVTIQVDGAPYGTGVPVGGEFLFFPVDLLAGDGHTEFFIMRENGGRSELYLCRMVDGAIQQGTFTYLIPASLSESGMEEARYMDPSLVFSGVEPIVNLRDGSFAVLAMGQGFQRYVVDDALNVTEDTLLPLTLLTTGTAELLTSATPAPAEIADPSVEDPAYTAGTDPALDTNPAQDPADPNAQVYY